MRHRVERKRLSRDKDNRKALLMNLSQALIEHESIETTIDKAKYLRPFIERLISKAKAFTNQEDKVKSFNVVKKLRTVLGSETDIKKLVSDIAPRYKDTNGGYTRITRTRFRDGDNSLMARIELVKHAEVKAEVKKEKENKNAK
jgi:large subunit ribosomal protein L17